ncbi:hypothetical protein AAG906_005479 [Vitis piasezkii]
MPGPSEPIDPSQDAPLVEQIVPHEETTIVEIETPIQSTQTTTVEPSLHVTQETPLPRIFNHSCHIKGNVQLGWGEES